LVRRVAVWSLVADVVASLLFTAILGATVGFVVFVIGLAVVGLLYWNFSKVQRTRGTRY